MQRTIVIIRKIRIMIIKVKEEDKREITITTTTMVVVALKIIKEREMITIRAEHMMEKTRSRSISRNLYQKALFNKMKLLKRNQKIQITREEIISKIITIITVEEAIITNHIKEEATIQEVGVDIMIIEVSRDKVVEVVVIVTTIRERRVMLIDITPLAIHWKVKI